MKTSIILNFSIFLIIFILGLNPILSEKNVNAELKYEISYFGVKDFSRNLFEISILSNYKIEDGTLYKIKEKNKGICKKRKFDKTTNLTKIVNKQKVKLNVKIKINDIETGYVKCTFKNIGDHKIYYQIYGFYPVKKGKAKISLYYPANSSSPISTLDYFIPDKKEKSNEQPKIKKIIPNGGVFSDTVKIKGKNFGNDIDNIKIFFYKSKEEEGEDVYGEDLLGIYSERYNYVILKN